MKQGDAINAADDLNRYAEAGSFFYAKRISNDDWYVEHGTCDAGLGDVGEKRREAVTFSARISQIRVDTRLLMWDNGSSTRELHR